MVFPPMATLAPGVSTSVTSTCTLKVSKALISQWVQVSTKLESLGQVWYLKPFVQLYMHTKPSDVHVPVHMCTLAV